MSSWDIISDMIEFTNTEYPPLDIRKSELKKRKRLYERIMVDEIIDKCCDRMYNDPIEILESFELIAEHEANTQSFDIYRFRLNVVKKILDFLRRSSIKYG